MAVKLNESIRIRGFNSQRQYHMGFQMRNGIFWSLVMFSHLFVPSCQADQRDVLMNQNSEKKEAEKASSENQLSKKRTVIDRLQHPEHWTMGLHTVRGVDLAGKDLSNEDLSELTEYINGIAILDVSSNPRLSDGCLKYLRVVSSLERLRAQDCNFNGESFDELSTLPRLSEVFLNNNPISVLGLNKIGHLPYLTVLGLAGGLPSIKHIDRMTGLETSQITELNLSNNEMIISDFDHLRRMPRLVCLHIGGHLDPWMFRSLREFKALRYINITSGIGFNLDCAKELARCKNLNSISLPSSAEANLVKLLKRSLPKCDISGGVKPFVIPKAFGQVKKQCSASLNT